MVTPPEKLPLGTEGQFHRGQIAMGIFVFIIPTVTLFSWWSNHLYWASLGEGLIPMAPSSALCFLALSLTLLIPRYTDTISRWEWAALIPTLAVAVFSVVVLLQLLPTLSTDIEALPAPCPG